MFYACVSLLLCDLWWFFKNVPFHFNQGIPAPFSCFSFLWLERQNFINFLFKNLWRAVTCLILSHVLELCREKRGLILQCGNTVHQLYFMSSCYYQILYRLPAVIYIFAINSSCTLRGYGSPAVAEVAIVLQHYGMQSAVKRTGRRFRSLRHWVSAVLVICSLLSVTIMHAIITIIIFTSTFIFARRQGDLLLLLFFFFTCS